MRHYLMLLGAMVIALLGLFALAEALDLELLTRPGRWLAQGGMPAAALGVFLLVVDVALPVPSSIVMALLGAAFGVVLGAALSMIGSLGAAWLGFAIGRRGGPLLARLVPADERNEADRMLQRWGGLAILLSRPVPILAEAVAVLAGTSSLGWTELTLAAFAGSLPACLLYALSGALAYQAAGNFLLVFLLVLLLAAVFWLLARRVRGS